MRDDGDQACNSALGLGMAAGPSMAVSISTSAVAARSAVELRSTVQLRPVPEARAMGSKGGVADEVKGRISTGPRAFVYISG